MTNRLTSTLAAADITFNPTAETILQMDSEVVGPKVEVLARVDAGAQWVQVGVMSGVTGRMLRIPQFPNLKLSMSGNTAGKTVNVWSN